VTLRTGVLWPLIVIHALIDLAGFATSNGTVMTSVTSTDIVIYMLYLVVFTAYGIFMMRSVMHSPAQHRPNTDTPGVNGPDPIDGSIAPLDTRPS